MTRVTRLRYHLEVVGALAKWTGTLNRTLC